MDDFEKKISDFKQPEKTQAPDVDQASETDMSTKPEIPAETAGLPIEPPHKSSRKLLGVVVIVALLAASAAASYFVWLRPSSTTTASVPAVRHSPSPTAVAATSDASLQNDLSNIQTSLNQADTDQSNADSALNDQQIAVPTE